MVLVRTYNAGLKCAARDSLKYRTQKGCKNWPSAHHLTTLSGYIFAIKACINNGNKNLLNTNISSTSPHNMVNFNPLMAETGWRVWGTPANFNGVNILASLLQRHRSIEVNQTLHMFGRLLGWYTFSGALAPNGILQSAKFTLCPSLAFSCFGSVTVRHWSSGRQPNFAAWYSKWNYGTFAPCHFQQRAPPIFQGRPSRWA